ncbi:peroxiredoxin [Bradyrhizobium sediminis]|uniref:thioredoxin-dependent peroxiredoxin n=1 Tax=Bradyrhizobium sediminis TaxID=2840469 RepID=A0A975P3K7_9BRAD|nr:peroxiredoxin [Bradyrhizobium sediminis]QWG26005.1 peroxiredoxin [Bradyrhizobium sediminis]
MSKKTRKKSPKTPPPKAVRTKSGKSTKTSAKKPSAKASKAAAKKSGKAASKPAGAASAKASHKAPSKPLRKTVPAGSPAQTAAASKTPAGKLVAPTSRATGLTEGAMAPAFRLPRDGGDTVSLADYRGRKLVLFFYPRADTPGCTKEAIDFTRLSSAFAEHQTAVLGVSADPLKAQEAFRDKHELTTPLVSDEQHEMLEAYGVWGEKSMYGRTFLGILRTTVLLGADGRIVKVWRNVKVDGHAEEVLAAVRAL